MAKCRKCGANAGWMMALCDSCISAAQEEPQQQYNQQTEQSKIETGSNSTSPNYGQGAIDVLRFFAWINLIAGIIIALYIWSTLASISVQGRISSYNESNPLGIILGIGFLAEGVFGCAFLLVVCSMAENLIAIRKNTKLIDVQEK